MVQSIEQAVSIINADPEHIMVNESTGEVEHASWLRTAWEHFKGFIGYCDHASETLINRQLIYIMSQNFQDAASHEKVFTKEQMLAIQEATGLFVADEVVAADQTHSTYKMSAIFNSMKDFILFDDPSLQFEEPYNAMGGNLVLLYDTLHQKQLSKFSEFCNRFTVDPEQLSVIRTASVASRAIPDGVIVTITEQTATSRPLEGRVAPQTSNASSKLQTNEFLGMQKYQQGREFEVDAGMERDPATKQKLLKQALDSYRIAENNKAKGASFKIGFFYEFGLGVTKDPIQARLHYSIGAVDGDPECHFALGRCYEHGSINEPKDLKQAYESYAKAAQGGLEKAKGCMARVQSLYQAQVQPAPQATPSQPQAYPDLSSKPPAREINSPSAPTAYPNLSNVATPPNPTTKRNPGPPVVTPYLSDHFGGKRASEKEIADFIAKGKEFESHIVDFKDRIYPGFVLGIYREAARYSSEAAQLAGNLCEKMGDHAEALKWYQNAAERGQQEAIERLKALNNVKP